MPDGEDGARQVADDLVDLDVHAALLVDRVAHGVHAAVDRGELPGPVVADRVVAVHASALPSVRPVHIRGKTGQYRVDVAGVERGVEALEGFHTRNLQVA